MIVFTTFLADRLPAADLLRWCPVRWQAELTFKRFKSLVGLGICRSAPTVLRRGSIYGKCSWPGWRRNWCAAPTRVPFSLRRGPGMSLAEMLDIGQTFRPL